jgi:formamidopyrimidine-DNA glycosylase
MPELPEVETVRAGLSRLIIGKQITAVDFDWPKSFPNDQNAVSRFLVGASIIDVSRRAKVLLVKLSGDYSLIIHLKMTGQLVFRSEAVAFGAGHPSDSLMTSVSLAGFVLYQLSKFKI